VRGGACVHLAPQAYRLLEILIEQRPRVVKKQELDELLWPSSFVARSSLGRIVTELRAALGDDAQAPQLVRTVHAVGYAFCGAVEQVGETAPAHIVAVALLWGSRSVTLTGGEHLLGRGPQCDVLIDAPGVSRSHARIRVGTDATTIADLGSKNGTYVNRRRIAGPTVLRDADEIALGTAVLTVSAGAGNDSTHTVFMR
jgi:FHA domain